MTQDGTQRGFALLIVLWTLSLLALLAAEVTSSARSEIQLARNLGDNARLDAAAEGAVMEAVFHLVRGDWTVRDGVHQLRVGPAVVRVAIEDQSGKINPNFVAVNFLESLLRNLGAEPAMAATLAREIVDWRTRTPVSLLGGPKTARYAQAHLPYGPSLRPFANIEEVGLVPNMPKALFARLRPLLSVYKDDEMDRKNADPLAVQAQAETDLTRPVSPLTFRSGSLLVVIRANAAGQDGGRSDRAVTVRIKAGSLLGDSLFEILAWSNSNAPPE